MPVEQFAFVPRYIEQMMLAASVTLLKILTSFYASHVDVDHGRNLFFGTVTALRKLSVRSNDLPQRLAEVMAQLWQASGASEAGVFKGDGSDMSRDHDDSLQLKVRCRSSLSVLYDAIWRWRERAGQAGRESLATADTNPTALPTDVNDGGILQPPNGLGGPMAPSHGLLDGTPSDFEAASWDNTFGGNAVFDPLSWALDGNFALTGGSLFGGTDGMGLPPFG